MSVLEAYARLKSLRQNVPSPYVEQKYVEEFHACLDLLERASDGPLSGFRVPASEVRPVCVAGSYLSGDIEYSDEPYCDHSFFLMKLDAVITMFELLQSSAASSKGPIGFNPPGR